ncbi:MAG: serine/threonine-protein kinase RsbW [Frankiaceae bacterium]|jgi:anti-sigma regulatory factor (Ser/Thr protein kinase)|nr:serine/threonine-protein kinase RsbW [Frankiaceae bacterium]
MRAVETLSVPGTLPGVRQAVEAFEQFGRTNELPHGAVWRFLLALDEILSNSIRHGGGRQAIELTFSIDEAIVAVEIVDAADAFNPLLAPAPDTGGGLDERQPGGLGIFLVRELMDDTRYERRDERNHFTMRWRTDGDR